MGYVRGLVSRALEAREQIGIPVKQALGEATISLPSGELSEEYCKIFADEVNVKKVIVKMGDLSVVLNTELTPELIREGMAREVTRKVNALRKEAGLTIQDRIALFISGEHADIALMLEEHGKSLESDTLAASVMFGKGEALLKEQSLRVHERDITVGFRIA